MGVSIERWAKPHPVAEKAAAQLKNKFGDAVEETTVFQGEVSVVIAPERIVETCRYLKLDPDFTFDLLTDITGIHFIDRDYGYEVVYHLYSFEKNCRLRLKVRLAETGKVPTVTGVWATADWHEREAYDLVGIVFEGHPDLRRILMPEDYEFHPLRRDFPLEGHGA
jgi:NADH-quinone oxidoreductase subunit C